jgi:hypothetical protein
MVGRSRAAMLYHCKGGEAVKEAEHWRWLRNNKDKHPNLRDCLKDYEEMKAKLEQYEGVQCDPISEPYKGPLESNPIIPSWCQDE